MSETCPYDKTQTQNPPTARFNPYILFRRGMLPFSALASLVPVDTWSLLDRAHDEAQERRALGDLLADYLYGVIPKLASGDEPIRRLALQARRDLHNDRLPADAAVSVLTKIMDQEHLRLFQQWIEARSSATALEKAARETLASELAVARGRLAEFPKNEFFQKGIQLSGAKLAQNINQYIDHLQRDNGEPRSKKLRQAESSIVRYAYRMALRTSPFGSFTEIGAQAWCLPEGLIDDPNGSRKSIVRLSRSLLVWMACELRKIEGSDRLLNLRLNNTLERNGDSLEVFNRGLEGGTHSYWGEAFTNLRIVPPVAVILEALNDGPRSKAEVLQRLEERGMSAPRAVAFIDRLVEAGVCHEGLGLSDQTRDFAMEVARLLRGVDLPQAAACADCFEKLDQIETQFSQASAEQRETMLGEITQTVNRFSRICGVAAPLEAGRTPIFEDIGANRPAQSWDPELLERNQPNFARLLRLLPVFHHSTMEKLGIYSWFASHFGENGSCDDLLKLYRLFSDQSQEEVSSVLQARNDPYADRIRALRQEWLRGLDEAVIRNGDSPTLRLEPACLDDLRSALPDFLPFWSEASFRVQIAPAGADDSAKLIVNDVTTGHGVFFSRFCDLVEPDEHGQWSLREALSDAIAINSPGQADLIAVFGHNVNLHPRLTRKEVVYPGAVPSGAENVLTLRDVSAKADAATRSIQLFDRRDGRPIQLTPMNFLFPAAAPMLYRFLCVFSPLYTYRVSWWNRLRQMTRDGRLFLPRLMLGDLVLERRRWYVPAASVTALGDGAGPDTPESLLAAERWRIDRGLPRECFFQVEEVSESAETTEPGRNWVEETRKWALSARNARRKRQYLDFRNPLLTRLLCKQADGVAGGEVVFQECLPPTAAYLRGGSAQSAEEFLVELHDYRIDEELGELA